MLNIIKIQIGDCFLEGHRQYTDFIFYSHCSMEEIRAAYILAKEKYPNLCPENFCNNYKDFRVPDYIVEEAKKLNYKINPDDFYVTEMALYTAWFCCLGDDYLDLILVEDIPTLSCNKPSKNKSIGYIGYGFF